MRIPDAVRWAVFERDDFTCRACGSRRQLSVDHIDPDGGDDESNLQTLCISCNSSKQRRRYNTQPEMALKGKRNILSSDQMDEGRRKAIAKRKARSAQLERVILPLIQQGYSQSDIASSLNLKRQSVHRIVKRLRAEGKL